MAATRPTRPNLVRDVRIAPFWANMETYQTGDDVFISTTATSITFRWQGTLNADGSAVNFAVTLFTNGTFRFDYGAGNASPAAIIGVSSANPNVFVTSAYQGLANLNNAKSTSWTPSAGLTYFDIGALEFQGNSADHTAAHHHLDQHHTGQQRRHRPSPSPASSSPSASSSISPARAARPTTR